MADHFLRDLGEIVLLSLEVSLSAVALAALLGVPSGAVLALGRFRGRGVAILLVNAAMGLPPVVVGLALYLLFSRSGPLGPLGLLYTPAAMIAAQMILVVPIIASFTRETLEGLDAEYADLMAVLRASFGQRLATLLVEARPALVTALLAGLGRALSEVGAVMIVGGNIAHHTRVMTTAITLETSKGNLSLALALGGILLVLALGINLVVGLFRERMRGAAHA